MATTKLIGVKVSADIYSKFELAAKQNGSSTISGWLRDVGTKAVADIARSWGNIDPAERGALWKQFQSRGAALPPEFNTWPSNERVAYMDKTFPLEAK